MPDPSAVLFLSLMFGAPALCAGLRVGSAGGRRGEKIFLTAARCWVRALFLFLLAAILWLFAGTLLAGLQMGDFGRHLHEWSLEFLRGLAVACALATVAAGLPSMMFGVIAYNFGAQKRAAEALAQSGEVSSTNDDVS